MQSKFIKRIINGNDFNYYDIPEDFGKEAVLLILPLRENNLEIQAWEESETLQNIFVNSGVLKMLNEKEEEAWDEF